MAGMIRKLVVSGVATKIFQEARKPQNQAKIKQFVGKIGDQVKNRGGDAGGAAGRAGRGRGTAY